MDCRDWERIVKNWDKFMDVHPKDVLDHLYQDGIWECKPTERKIENIYDLLEMLQKKPGTNTFGCFKRALKEGGHEELAAEIEATEVSADPSLKPRGDPSILEPKVRQALLCKFREMKDSKVSLSVIREVLVKESVFGGNSWTNGKLKDFLLKTFNSVEILPSSQKSSGNKKIKFITVMNLKKIDDVPEEETSLACAKETPKRDDRLTSRVKLMSCMELREFLVQHFQEKSLPDEAFTCLENQRVCGEIFLTLTERDLKEILPDAEFGTIRHLSLLIEQLLPDAEFGAIRHLSLLIKQLTEQPPWGKNVLQSFCCEMLEATMAFCGL